jgi:hypothetical protein
MKAVVYHAMRYRGSTLSTDDYLSPGDFLVSDNGRFCGYMNFDGSFAVYWMDLPHEPWNPKSLDDPGFGLRIWRTTPAQENIDAFLVVQGDGNVCTYRGTGPADNRGIIWQSQTTGLTPGPYHLVMQVDGNLCLYGQGQAFIWGIKVSVQDLGFQRLRAMMDYTDPNTGGLTPPDKRLVLSSILPSPIQSSAPATQAIPPQNDYVSMQAGGASGDDGDWRVLVWNMNDQTIGYLFINSQSGRALHCNGGGMLVDTAWQIDDAAIWTRGGNENFLPTGTQTAIRSRLDDGWNLNVRGNGPYQSGGEVICWQWSSVGWKRENMIWEIGLF